MAIWFAPGSHQGIQAELRADSSADVADLPAFADANFLKPGSSCLVIGASELYMMDSENNWKQM